MHTLRPARTAPCALLPLFFAVCIAAGDVAAADVAATRAPTPPAWPASFADVSAEPAFEPFLRANPFLMANGGANVVRFPGGTNLVLGIGMTDLRPVSPQETLRRRTVARQKALAALSAEVHGVRVYSTAAFFDQTTVRIDTNCVESATSVSESLETTRSETAGWLPGLPVVATWTNPSLGLYYLAVGGWYPSRENTNHTNSDTPFYEP